MMWTTQVQFLPRLKWKKLIDAEEGLVSGLWCLTPLSTIFQLNRSVLLENTTDLSQVTVKLYHMILYRVLLTMNGVRTHNLSGNGH